jgi:hypothetical protein
MTRAISSPMTENVIDDAAQVIDDAGTRRGRSRDAQARCARGAGRDRSRAGSNSSTTGWMRSKRAGPGERGEAFNFR